MVDQAPNVPLQNSQTRSHNRHEPNTGITEEQVRAIADRVYIMLLKKLRYERERNRSMVDNSNLFKRG